MRATAVEVVTSVRRLVADVEARWADAGRTPERFPALAADALRRHRLDARHDLDAWLTAFSRSAVLPTQTASGPGWGEPPVTVLHGDGFYVDVYFFVEPTLSVHSHSFAGAFTLLHGRAAHTRFELDPGARVHGPFVLGALRAEATELLEPGDVRAVPRGLELIHNVTHLSRPTVSLVVRTGGAGGDIHAFLLPGLGLQTTAYLDETARTKLGLVEMMCRTGQARRHALVGAMIDQAEDLPAAWIAWRLFTLERDADALARLLSPAQRAARVWVAPLVAAARRDALAPATGLGERERERLERSLSTLLADPARVARALARHDEMTAGGVSAG